MNLLDKYTPHELMEMTIRDIKKRQKKRERDLMEYQLGVSDKIKKRCKMKRRGSEV